MQFLNDFVLYFFYPTPGRAFQYFYFVGALIVLLIGLGIFLKVVMKKKNKDKIFRKLFRRYPSKLWTVAAFLILYLIVRYNMVPFLSMRFMLYILLGVTFYLFYVMINTYLKKYPEAKKRHDEQMVQNKYRIKKKKRK